MRIFLKIPITTFLVSLAVFSLAQETDTVYEQRKYLNLHEDYSKRDYSTLEFAYALKPIKLYSDSTGNDIITEIETGRELKIIYDKHNPESKFLPVEPDNGLSGFVSKNHLAYEKIEAGNHIFLFSTFTSDSITGNRSEVRLNVHVANKISGKIIQQEAFQLADPTLSFSIRILGNKGLDLVDNIIEINYLGEACGLENGYTYITFDQQKGLNRLADISVISEAGLFYLKETLIFPEDENGKKGIVFFKSKLVVNESEDYNNEKPVTTIKEKTYQWIDGKLSPEFKPAISGIY